MFEGLHPVCLTQQYRRAVLYAVVARFVFKAGLLTFGSSYSLHLPIALFHVIVVLAEFVPDYSGGTAPEFNGIPY